MVDKQLVTIAGAIAGAVMVSVTLIGRVYGVFSDRIGAEGAIVISVMGLVLYALLVLAVDNRIKINQTRRGDDE
jgi:Na+(H+)/acetate symporter ActP